MVRYEKMKGKIKDEIKRAGLESLEPEELEKHLILNSNRLETFRGFVLGGCEVYGGEIWFKNS